MPDKSTPPPSQQHWLIKSEPSVYSIDDLKRDKKTSWEGVRNYQARNYIRDSIKPGDLAFFYHSNAEPSGIAGVAKACSKPYGDPTALDKKSEYFDSKSTPDEPIWFTIDFAFVKRFDTVLSVEKLKTEPRIRSTPVLQRGQRLSVMPVSEEHFRIILAMAGAEV
jgi:predicted RNA-binding protein with PUA-like domain